MAEETREEQITRLEADKSAIEAEISAQRTVKEVEEGGAGARFRTVYDNQNLKTQLKEIKLQLRVLYSARGL